MRTVVVGASSGLGRCIGVGLGERGDRVALLARRADRLAAAREAAGPGAVAVQCDATDEESCRAAIKEAAEAMGGIDGLVYAPGVGPLARIEDVDGATWASTFATNVIGASIVTAAALPHLRESNGRAVYLSSISASTSPPWPGLGAYVVTKAALERLVEAWRAEHPSVGFTRIVVGECGGGEGDAMTEFASSWDPELAGQMVPVWLARGYMSGGMLEVAELVDAVHSVLTARPGSSIHTMVVSTRAPV